MKALILAGGLGTRLRPVLPDTAKPMAPVRGRPFVEYLVAHLARHGLTEIVLCIGYLGQQLRDHFGDGSRFGVAIRYSDEPQPMGTGGALKLAEPLIGADRSFLVANGDSFFGADLRALIDDHRRRAALATMALTRVLEPDAARYGGVELDDQMAIARFVEKGAAGSAGGLINAGLYLFERRVLEVIPAGIPVSLERETFPRLVGDRFYGLPLSGFFVDIGLPASYQEQQRDPGALSAPPPGAGGGKDADSGQGTPED